MAGITEPQPHAIPGIFTLPGNVATHGDDALFTLSSATGGGDSAGSGGKHDIAAGERLFRHWSPKRSKLAAVVLRGLDPDDWPFRDGDTVLYLGAANGTTVSYLSDILPSSTIHCVEFSRRAFRDLMAVARDRPNIVPLLMDATRPGAYRVIVGSADVIYQDVSQRDQTGIFLENARMLLRKGGAGVLMYKARSTDVTADPAALFRAARAKLSVEGFTVRQPLTLEPYEKDHALILARKG